MNCHCPPGREGATLSHDGEVCSRCGFLARQLPATMAVNFDLFVDRVRSARSYLTEAEIVEALRQDNVSVEDAQLLIRAAEILDAKECTCRTN